MEAFTLDGEKKGRALILDNLRDGGLAIIATIKGETDMFTIPADKIEAIAENYNDERRRASANYSATIYYKDFPIISNNKGDEESWEHTWIIDRFELENQDNPDNENRVTFKELFHHLVYPYGSGIPGQVFHDSAHVKRTPFHIIITQRGGLDV